MDAVKNTIIIVNGKDKKAAVQKLSDAFAPNQEKV